MPVTETCGPSSGPVVAVDWGTSSFRLWVLDTKGHVLSESRGPEGMISAAKIGYPEVLAKHLAAASAPAGAPVVISGMAGARQGWREAPYLPVGCALPDLPGSAVLVPFPDRGVYIMPGVARTELGRADVMRGEETQLLGLLSKGTPEIVVMPGTHSKWVEVEGDRITGFSTHMTGELFSLLSTRSTLAPMLEHAGPTDPASEAFLTAVEISSSAPAAALDRMFAIRADGLLNHACPSNLRNRLSGLLIGAEIGLSSARNPGRLVTLVAAAGAALLYRAALEQAGIAHTFVDAEAAARAGLHRAARVLQEERIA